LGIGHRAESELERPMSHPPALAPIWEGEWMQVHSGHE
jgi:hypothetical protein